MPQSFSREHEFRHPYVDVIIKVTIATKDPGPTEVVEEMDGTLIKINEYEAVIRTGKALGYTSQYTLNFTAMEFNFSIVTVVLANQIIKEGNIVYYTLKFIEMSEPAHQVLKRFMYDHL